MAMIATAPAALATMERRRTIRVPVRGKRAHLGRVTR